MRESSLTGALCARKRLSLPSPPRLADSARDKGMSWELAMITNDENNLQARVALLEIVWRNPLSLVQAHLRVNESSNPYYGWVGQAGRIRARRAKLGRQLLLGSVAAADDRKARLPLEPDFVPTHLL